MAMKLFIKNILASLLLCFTCMFSTETKAQQEDSKPIEVYDQFLISDHRAGIFLAGESIPFTKAEELMYIMRKEIEIQSTPDGDQEDPYYIFSLDGVDLVKISPNYIYDSNSHGHLINEIIVLSDKFHTKEDIRIGSSIKAFSKSYPNNRLWYTYISGMYVIDSDDLKVQFLLDENDFTGKMEVESDMTILKMADFKEEAIIQSIRII